jgi:tetratricopeptide (TPR) repeat protein
MMRLARWNSRLAVVLVVAMSVAALTGCNRLQARQLIRKGNNYFKAQQYIDALKMYQDALALDPTEVRLHKFVGYAAMALYPPGSQQEKDLTNAKLAIDSFKTYLATQPEDADKVSQFLVTMYMNAGLIDDAIGFFKQWSIQHPKDDQAVNSIAMLYAKQADYEKTVDWQQKRIDMLKTASTPSTEEGAEAKVRLAEAYYTLGVTCWQKSYDSSEAMLPLDKRMQVLEKGMQALNRAIEVRPGYSDAMAYTNLIYRQYAMYEADPAKQAQYTAQADEWLKKAMAAREAEKQKEREEAAKGNLLEGI